MPKFFVEDLSTMKKIIALALAVIMLCALAAVPASAIPEGCTAIDITSNVKFMTTYEMYKTGTPIVRDDALFINVQDDLKIDEPDYYAPGGMGKSRDITIMGLNLKDKMDQLQYDPFFLMPESEEYWPDSTWMYYAIWPNIPKNIEGYTKARVVYEFEVKTPGEYEFVFVGAAQIKKADIDSYIEDNNLVIPFTIINSIAFSVSDEIINERNKGLFKSFYDFMIRCYGKSINKRVVVSLIECGAFDNFNINKKSYIDNIDEVLNYVSLCKDLNMVLDSKPVFESISDYSDKELIELEIKNYGFFL